MTSRIHLFEIAGPIVLKLLVAVAVFAPLLAAFAAPFVQ